MLRVILTPPLARYSQIIDLIVTLTATWKIVRNLIIIISRKISPLIIIRASCLQSTIWLKQRT